MKGLCFVSSKESCYMLPIHFPVILPLGVAGAGIDQHGRVTRGQSDLEEIFPNLI